MSTTLELPIVTEVKAKASLEAYLMTAHYQKWQDILISFLTLNKIRNCWTKMNKCYEHGNVTSRPFKKDRPTDQPTSIPFSHSIKNLD